MEQILTRVPVALGGILPGDTIGVQSKTASRVFIESAVTAPAPGVGVELFRNGWAYVQTDPGEKIWVSCDSESGLVYYGAV